MLGEGREPGRWQVDGLEVSEGSSSPMRGGRLHTQQHVGQGLLGVDVVGLARGHPRVEAGEVLPCGLVPDKEKVLAIQGRLSQGPPPPGCCRVAASVRDETAQRLKPPLIFG